MARAPCQAPILVSRTQIWEKRRPGPVTSPPAPRFLQDGTRVAAGLVVEPSRSRRQVGTASLLRGGTFLVMPGGDNGAGAGGVAVAGAGAGGAAAADVSEALVRQAASLAVVSCAAQAMLATAG